jgi:hypothetical protein
MSLRTRFASAAIRKVLSADYDGVELATPVYSPKTKIDARTTKVAAFTATFKAVSRETHEDVYGRISRATRGDNIVASTYSSAEDRDGNENLPCLITENRAGRRWIHGTPPADLNWLDRPRRGGSFSSM